MALGNFIKQNSYTYIKQINYLKDNKVIEIVIVTYENDLLQNKISEMQIFKSIDSDTWDKKFDLKKNANVNIMKMGYDFIKTQPGFESVTDI